MPITDYQEIVDRLQKGLGRAFREDPILLNVPGRSVACKVDANYYLALDPHFINRLSKLSAVSPANVLQTLIKTGNLISKPPEREHALKVAVAASGRTAQMNACFVLAEFIDRALKLYGGVPSGLEVSELRIARASKPDVDAFFGEKTPPHNIAYEAET